MKYLFLLSILVSCSNAPQQFGSCELKKTNLERVACQRYRDHNHRRAQ